MTKPETLTLTVSAKGTGSGAIQGTLAFDRKDYGMNGGIPFIKIANRVEVTVGFKAKQGELLIHIVGVAEKHANFCIFRLLGEDLLELPAVASIN